MDQQPHTIRIILERIDSVNSVESSFNQHGFYKLSPSPSGLTRFTAALNIGAAQRRMNDKDLPQKPEFYMDEGGHIIVQWSHPSGMVQFAQALSDAQVMGSVEIDDHPIRIDGQSEGHFLLSELSKALLRGSYERLADIKQVDTQIYELIQKFVATHEQPHPIFKLSLKGGEVVVGSINGHIDNLEGHQRGVVYVRTDTSDRLAAPREIDMRYVVSVSLVNSSK